MPRTHLHVDSTSAAPTTHLQLNVQLQIDSYDCDGYLPDRAVAAATAAAQFWHLQTFISFTSV
jgi:hypothetical protein